MAQKQKLLIVEENTAPAINITLNRDGDAIDLTNVSSVDLYIVNGTTTTNTGHTSCTIVSPTAGTITYTAQSADFANPATYDCEVKITYTDGSIERIYESFIIKARTKLA